MFLESSAFQMNVECKTGVRWCFLSHKWPLTQRKRIIIRLLHFFVLCAMSFVLTDVYGNITSENRVTSHSPVTTGAPVIVSFPHFYLGDRKYIQAIDGLSPNQEDHQTYLDLNPVQGACSNLSKLTKEYNFIQCSYFSVQYSTSFNFLTLYKFDYLVQVINTTMEKLP